MLNAAYGAQKDYTLVKLSTGQTVIVKPVRSNPIVTIDTWIKTGSINEDDKNSGVAHFLEHLFFKGTKNTPPGEFDKILESKGALTNAATSKDFTHYYITIPSKDFDLALKLHSDMLLNPLIPRKELEKERLVVLEEISRGLDSPSSVMYNNLFKKIYSDFEPNHPYKRPVIGSKNVIETITREEILDFYNKWYTPSNMTTIIVGDIDPAVAVQKVEEYFMSANPDKNIKEDSKAPVYPKIKPIDKQLRIEEKKDVKTGYIAIAYKAPKFKDDKDSYALDVLATILGDSRSSVLNRNLKEKKQLVYSISASNSSFMDDGLFIIQATFNPANAKAVEDAIYSEINALKKGNISDNDVKKAINMIKTSTYYARESISNISNELGYLTLFWGNTGYYDNYISNIENVKKADVARVAKKYLDNSKTAVSLVLPENIKPISDIKPAVPKTYTAKIVETGKDTTKYSLANGATLIIKKNDINSIIAIDITSKGGNNLEKIPGTATLAASSATKGTKNYDYEQFARLLDERGIKLGLSSGSDTFDISLLATKNELDFALDMLNEVVNYPLFNISEIEKAKKLSLASLKSIQDNALSIGIDEFKKTAYPNTVYANTSDVLQKNIPLVTKEDIEEYYNTILEPKNLIITVVGDVESQNIIDKMTTIFNEKNKPVYDIKQITNKTFVPQSDITKKIVKPDTQTAWVLIGFKTDNIFNEKDRATLKVINAILGEGMSSRLFKNLRDNQGLAYSVGSTLSSNIGQGAFMAYIGTNPKNVETAKQGMLHEIYRFKSEFVPQKELDEAKDKIMGNLLISLETNMDDASLLGWYGVLGYDINHLQEYKKLIESVTASDILAVANKYFSNPYINITVTNK